MTLNLNFVNNYVGVINKFHFVINEDWKDNSIKLCFQGKCRNFFLIFLMFCLPYIMCVYFVSVNYTFRLIVGIKG